MQNIKSLIETTNKLIQQHINNIALLQKSKDHLEDELYKFKGVKESSQESRDYEMQQIERAAKKASKILDDKLSKRLTPPDPVDVNVRRKREDLEEELKLKRDFG